MSTRSGNRGKHRKAVQTTLGKAPQIANRKYLDLSHLRKPIDTSLFGLTQILSLFETATDEVRRYIAYECDLMFECRICRTVFRSVANFVLHKRNYCPEVHNKINSNNKSDFENSDLTIVNQDSFLSNPKEIANDTGRTSKQCIKRNLSLVLKKLSDKQECHEYTQSILSEEMTEGSSIKNKECNEEKKLAKTVYLEQIENNKEGVFQTMNCKNVGEDLMKSEVMEIHSILDSNEAILGPDGKVFAFKSKINDTSGRKLICTVCNLKFATKKTLTHHIKYKHNDTRVVYICPECKESFANAWCVFRHLYKVHRKTTSQIRRMRDQIHSSAIIKKQEPIKKNAMLGIENDVENDLSQEDSQLCEGCGKRFERKAALHSHTQMCLKRLALDVARESQKHMQEAKTCKQKNVITRGSSKRKPNISQKIVRQCSLDVICDNVNYEECIDEVHQENKINKCEVTMNTAVGNIKDDTTVVENTAYQKHLIQEIILGSRGTGSLDGGSDSYLGKKFIGFISDEEEILGFLKGRDIAMRGSNTPNTVHNEDTNKVVLKWNEKDIENHCLDKVNFLVKAEEPIIHPLLHQNVENLIDPNLGQIESDGTKPEGTIIHIDGNKSIQKNMEDTFGNLLEVRLRQYPSKKNKTDTIIKPPRIDKLNLLPSDQTIDKTPHNLTLINNNTNTTEIDLPYDMQISDIKIAAECDVSESNEVLTTYSSDSERCSCFDEDNSRSSAVELKKNLDENFIENKADKKKISDQLSSGELKPYSEQTCDGDKKIIKNTVEKNSDLGGFDEFHKENRIEIKPSFINIKAIKNENFITSTTKEVTEELIQDSTDITENMDEILLKIKLEQKVDDENNIKENANESEPLVLLEQISADNEDISQKSDLLESEENAEQHIVSIKENVEGNNTCEADNHGKKRKYSDELTTDDSLDNSLHDKCEKYVNWNKLSCQSCLSTFETTEKLMEHMALHFNWLQYECTSCNYMSYDRNTCKQHLCVADTEIESIDKLIVSLPLWKTISMATPFTNIKNDPNSLSDMEDGYTESNENHSILTCNANEIKIQDPSLRKMIMEVIFGLQDTTTESGIAVKSTRPIRNRRSIQTMQKDFEYDMQQIDTKMKKGEHKVKPIKIVKNGDFNFHVVNVTEENNKKKRTC